MLTELRTAYVDTDAARLTWALGMRPLPALAVLPLHVAGAQLELRLLGASHQVLMDGLGGSCSETVACLPAGGVTLPSHAAVALDGWDYAFSAHREHFAPGAFRARVAEVVRRAEHDPAGLAGIFPGSPHAMTAVIAAYEPCQDGAHTMTWRTWHTYPQTGEIVTTVTRVALH